MLVVGIIVVIGAFFLMRGEPKPQQAGAPVDQSSLVRESSHMTGKVGAKATLVEFGDYQCPACGAVEPLIKQVIETYKINPDFNFVFRNFPLPQHQNALIAAESAEAAGAQGKFWEMNEMIYEHQTEWENSAQAIDVFAGYAQQLGLNVDRFKQEALGNKYAEVINADQQDGNKLGVNATPTFYLNGEKLPGIPNLDTIKQLIEDKLK